MIIGTGIDIVKIDRFADKTNNTRFMARVFTMREREYLASKGLQSMAGLFAAKEAVVKALGCGFAGFFPCDIEILHNPSGKPYVKLHGEAKHKIKKKRGRRFLISISISHTDTDAIAMAVVSN